MENIDFSNKVQHILEYDDRYPAEVYNFVNAAVKYTIDRLEQNGSGRRRHINARELLDGMTDFGKEQFGPLAWNVFAGWHFIRPADIGNVVFNLVKENLFAVSEEDSRRDFDLDYDLQQRLEAPFRHAPADSRPEIPIIA